MAGIIEPVGLGEARPVDVSNLEAELSALWRTAAEDPTAESAVTRACTLTLLIYVESDEAAYEVTNLVAEVTRQNPCRAIIMTLEPHAASSGLEAWVSAHCHLPVAGEKQVCSEQITIRARGEAGRGLPSVVLPLTVSGLPIFLWWRAAGFSPPVYFDDILRVTQHVIVDSARFSPGTTHLQDLAAWLHKVAGKIQLTDLNWNRITPWRQLIAQGFDSPERRPYLDRLTRVRIEYEQDSARLVTQRAQGLLLSAWLASRLGWHLLRCERKDASQPRTFYFKSANGTVVVERSFRRVDNPCGVCFTIELIAEGASAARFSFSRGPDGKVVKTSAEVPGLAPIGRSVRLEVLDEAEILNEELKLGVRDRLYEEALSMVARMISS
ncbi:MAG: glucose-6-phosphate dehydrogenase assembly protein OpcA [Terriglobia bacterium]|jgi:glucose-6-phosphate dehydrogenase assembly protein OpcA